MKKYKFNIIPMTLDYIFFTILLDNGGYEKLWYQIIYQLIYSSKISKQLIHWK